MSIRWRNNKPIVEVYDPALKRKRHVKPRDFGVTFSGSQAQMAKQARLLEAKALEQVAESGRAGSDETCDSFAARWTRDYPRGESTNKTREERVRKFAEDFKGRTMRSVSRQEARAWAQKNSRTRVAEMRAMILWAAYTCMRPGEIYAARYSRLNGDIYDLQLQFNSKLGKETLPKHGSVGAIFVPEHARAAVLDKPRRLGDDLMFRTLRGQQFNTGSMNYYWRQIRTAAGLPNMDFYELRHFGASYMLNDLEMEPWVIAQQLRHADGGRLVVTLYGHPDRKKALEIIRRTYEPRTNLRAISGEGEGMAQ